MAFVVARAGGEADVVVVVVVLAVADGSSPGAAPGAVDVVAGPPEDDAVTPAALSSSPTRFTASLVTAATVVSLLEMQVASLATLLRSTLKLSSIVSVPS